MRNTWSCLAAAASENKNLLDITPVLEMIQDANQLNDLLSLIDHRLEAIEIAMNMAEQGRTNTSAQETASSDTTSALEESASSYTTFTQATWCPNSSAPETASSSRLTSFIQFGQDLLEKVLKRAHGRGGKKRFMSRVDRVTRKVISDLGKEMAQIHLLAAGLSVVVYVLDQIEQSFSNKKICVELMILMCHLAERVKQLNENTDAKKKLNEAVQFIVMASLMCVSQMEFHYLFKFFSASVEADDLQSIRSKVRYIYPDLHSASNIAVSERIQTIQSLREDRLDLIANTRSFPVGIEQQIAKVIELLEWENDNPCVSVVIYGIWGSGKTTLADAVFASMKLQGWKFSKVSLIQKDRLDPRIEEKGGLPKKGLDRRIEEKGGLDEELQSQILHDLTGIKKGAKDFLSGQQELKAVIEKETVFILIDNIVRREQLEKLLPTNITSPKKFRMLITSRKRNISAVIEHQGIKPCKSYPIESLSIEAALLILSRRIDRYRDKDFMLNRSIDQAYKIAMHCSCCPLFLQVIGDYLHEQNNEIKAYDKVVDWLQGGEAFSGDNDDIFDMLSIFWAYEDPTAQDAYLDICSFFHDWEWEKVACIVGERELESLEEGDLIQRRIKVDTHRINIRGLLLAAGRSKSKHNRFTSVELFSLALEKKQVLQQTKGVWLKGKKNRPIHISADKLDAMSKSLRVFSVEGLTIAKGKCNGQFDQLRFLQANGRGDDLPIDILQPIQLRELNILSSIQKFPKSIGQLQHLQTVVVVGRPNTSLKALPEDFCHLQSLKRFTLRWCMAFTALPAQFGSLTNLQHLDLSFCSELKELPRSFKHLLKLQYLNLQGCVNLAIPPHFLGKITPLQHLNFQDCRKLEILPTQVSCQASLMSLNLVGTSLEELPSEMGFLINMEILEVGSPFMKSLPASLGFMTNLQTLKIEGCTSLARLPDSLGLLRHLSIKAPQALKETVEQNLELHNRE